MWGGAAVQELGEGDNDHQRLAHQSESPPRKGSRNLVFVSPRLTHLPTPPRISVMLHHSYFLPTSVYHPRTFPAYETSNSSSSRSSTMHCFTNRPPPPETHPQDRPSPFIHPPGLLLTSKFQYLPPHSPATRDAFAHEYTAYASLRAANIQPPCTPACIAAVLIAANTLPLQSLPPDVDPTPLKRLDRLNKPLKALLLEFIPNAVTLEEYPYPPSTVIEAKTKEVLGRLHAAGLLHWDVELRNVMVTDEGEVRWVDFDCAITKDKFELCEALFAQEKKKLEYVFKERREEIRRGEGGG
ncbi:hypothetical protein K440DRAFT_640814 [Wilcoxina mikolae CBS 423.85]|nr:hypothetical protein K440DRAFT_640814 [Wilcoxina mikolae CBS 423.85]